MSYFSLAADTSADDGDFLNPTGGSAGMGGGSKLQSLFGMNEQMNRDPKSNQSLTYTAPKQPSKSQGQTQKQSESASAGTSTGVAFAVAVTAYRYVNNQNVKVGKVGAAILKNIPANDYKILMYVTKQQPVTTAQIKPSFAFTVQQNNYASFYDDQRQFWSVMFDSAPQLDDFSKQICLAKYFTHPSGGGALESSVTQDMSAKAGAEAAKPAVEVGDSLEVKYTGWLVGANDGTLGAVFDSNQSSDKMFRFKSGQGKVIKGWESGMMGMRKGDRRFLVIPPHLAYGAKAVGNKVPANSILAFEVQLIRMKKGKDSASVASASSVESLPNAVGAEPTAPAPHHPASHHQTTSSHPPADDDASLDDTVKGRTASLNEQLNSNANVSEKDDIRSRMARMGHSMLPAQSTTAASSDSMEAPPPGNTAAPTEVSSHAPQPQQPHPDVQQVYRHHQPQQQNGLPPQHPGMQRYSTPPPPRQQSPHLQHEQLAAYAHHQQPQGAYLSMPAQSHAAVAAGTTWPGPSYADITEAVQYPGGYTTGYGQRPAQYSLNQPSFGSDMLPMLMVESRQHNSELRLLQEKIDKMSGLVQEVRKDMSDSPIMSRTNSQNMDSAMIMLNVQRIMQENERVKQQLTDQNRQIETQQDKISQLLQQNQQHVERSTKLMEERNDSYKDSFEQNRNRCRQLEDDKRQLATKLSEATQRVGELQSEAEDAKQHDAELRVKFKELFTREKERANDAETKLQELTVDMEKLRELGSSTTEESEAWRKERDELASELEQLRSDNQQLVEERDSSATRWKEEREILESRLTKGKAEIEGAVKEASDLQAQLTASETAWQAARSARTELEHKLEVALERFGKLREVCERQKSELADRADDQQQVDLYKERYEKLRQRAGAMKQEYERALDEARRPSSDDARDAQDAAAEVKKIMNQIFQKLKARVENNEQYSGTDVLTLVLNIIKSTTLEMLKREGERDSEKEEDSDEESGSEDDDSDEEEKLQNEAAAAAEQPVTTNANSSEDDKVDKPDADATPEQTESETPPADSGEGQNSAAEPEVISPVGSGDEDDRQAAVYERDDVIDEVVADDEMEKKVASVSEEFNAVVEEAGGVTESNDEQKQDGNEQETHSESAATASSSFEPTTNPQQADADAATGDAISRDNDDRSPSPDRPRPPPLFDSADDDEDDDWIK